MSDYYKGYKGSLRYILDITKGYDNVDTSEDLKLLIDEVRDEALIALKLEEDYNIPGSR